jgi:hypothetical protein
LQGNLEFKYLGEFESFRENSSGSRIKGQVGKKSLDSVLYLKPGVEILYREMPEMHERICTRAGVQKLP